MPQGLVGFAHHRVFGLAIPPDGVPESFKLSQSLDAETPLSFIVMPLTPEAARIEPADLTEACGASGIEAERACLLYVVTVRHKEHGQSVDLTANFKAPIALFADPNGLEARTGNAFVQTDLSGDILLQQANTGRPGSVAASALESSIVDLAEEFTKLITTQRAYSAGAKITTADERLEKLIRIRRWTDSTRLNGGLE